MRVVNFFKLWKKFISMQLMHDFAYPFEFFMFMISRFVFALGGPILALVVYGLGSGIPGWTFHEFLLFNGTLVLFAGVAWTLFFVQAWRVQRWIELGEFDTILLRPVGLVKYLLVSGFDLDGIGGVFAGLAIIGIAVIGGNIQITFLGTFFYVYILFLALIIDFCLMLLIVALSLVFVKSEVVMNIIDSIWQFTRYPLNIFNIFIQFTFTFILPFAMASFYPVEAFLGRLNAGMGVKLTLTTIGFTLVTLFLFNLAKRKYTSAGG